MEKLDLRFCLMGERRVDFIGREDGVGDGQTGRGAGDTCTAVRYHGTMDSCFEDLDDGG